jgi:Uma2 family endonuclease
VESGTLSNSDPVEFLEGWLLPKLTKGPRHAQTKRQFLRLINPFVPASCFVDTQEAMTVSNSEPEPDIYVIRGPEEKYSDRHPGPGEVELVVEISDSSLSRDRGLKQRVYARAGVPSYWIINLIESCIEVSTQPSGDVDKPAYAQSVVYRSADEVPVMIDGKEVGRIKVADVLAVPK